MNPPDLLSMRRRELLAAGAGSAAAVDTPLKVLATPAVTHEAAASYTGGVFPPHRRARS